MVAVNHDAADQKSFLEQPNKETNVSSGDRKIIRDDRLREHSNVVSKVTGSRSYHGWLGDVRIQSSSRFLAPSSQSRGVSSKKVVAEEKRVLIVLSFVRKIYEFRYNGSLGRVSRALNIYPILLANSSIFMKCRAGDIQGLQSAFSLGVVSPYVRDQYGMTLLHYAASTRQSELCTLLLQLGVDPDQMSMSGM